MSLMGQREYSRHRGVSLAAVQKALIQGRIALVEGKIDSDLADVEWARNTHNPKPVIVRPVADKVEEPKAPAVVDLPTARPRPVEEPQPLEPSSFAAWRAKREQFVAKKAELDFLERTGELVDRDQVKAAAFGRGRVVRDALLSIPDRISSLIASKSDAAEIHKILTDEITEAIRELTREPAIAA